jgi:alpha-glucosidase
MAVSALNSRCGAVKGHSPRATTVPMRSQHDILLYKRTWKNEELLIALSTVHQPRKCETQRLNTVLLSTHLDAENKAMPRSILLRASEGVILKLLS